MIVIIIIALTVIFLICRVIQTTRKPPNFPPGPAWYPFNGCSGVVTKMVEIHGSQWKAFTEIKKQHQTDVLGLKLGKEKIVIVSTEEYIREIFTGETYEGRPNNFFAKLRCFGEISGITLASGMLWKIHRNFAFKHLKNFGFGKDHMEVNIQERLTKILQYIDENGNKPLNLKKSFSIGVMGILWQFVAGDQIEEERLNFLLELLVERSKAFTLTGGLLNEMPWCRFLFPELSGYSLIKRLNQQIANIIDEAIEKHENKKVKEDDFIYEFLQEVKQKTPTFTEKQLRTICLDFLIAGSQTTSNSLEFALLVVLRNKLMQQKIYEEIEEVIGNRIPCWSDRLRMTYTTAFMTEVQRYYTVTPLIGPRRAFKDSYLGKHFIPKDTIILGDLANLHFDKKIWENPEEFSPERFIDENGSLINMDRIYPFGMGRRRCPGESLARHFIFIILVGIIQKYKIEGSNGVLPTDDYTIGLVSCSNPFAANYIARK